MTGNSYDAVKASQDKLKVFVGSGQLVFMVVVLGTSCNEAAPEVNMLAAIIYLQALEQQREINKVVSILGSKTLISKRSCWRRCQSH